MMKYHSQYSDLVPASSLVFLAGRSTVPISHFETSKALWPAHIGLRPIQIVFSILLWSL